MKKAIYLFLIFLALCFGGLGFLEGQNQAWKEAEVIIANNHEDIMLGLYEMSITNLRACVLALDSDTLRFLDYSTKERLQVIGERATQCEEWWEQANKLAPSTEELDNLEEGRWFYNNWLGTIEIAIRVRTKMITVENKMFLQPGEEIMHEFAGLDIELSAHKEDMLSYRNRVEGYIIDSWK